MASHYYDFTTLKNNILIINCKLFQTRIQNDISVIGFGSPIFCDGCCVGAIGIAFNESLGEYHVEEHNEIKKLLKTGANEITRRLSYK